MENDPLINLKGMSLEEYSYLKQVIAGMNPRQAQNFVMFYSDRRKDPQEILLFTLLGFLGVAGIQRFITGQMGMGILYFLTLGLCFIGTIVDVVNHKSITLEFNRKAAYESAQLVKIMSNQGTETLINAEIFLIIFEVQINSGPAIGQWIILVVHNSLDFYTKNL